MTTTGKPAARPEMVTATQLRERGWTATLVRDLLGDPDELRLNRYRKSNAPMQLYLLARVEAAEARPEFSDAFEIARRRSETAKATTDEKRVALRARVERLLTADMSPVGSLTEVTAELAAEYNVERERWEPALAVEDPEVPGLVARWLREDLVRSREPEARMELLATGQAIPKVGKVGRAEVFGMLRARARQLVTERWPELGEVGDWT